MADAQSTIPTRGEMAAIRLQYGKDIEAATREVNANGGDATVEDLLVLLIRRGWMPPGPRCSMAGADDPGTWAQDPDYQRAAKMQRSAND